MYQIDKQKFGAFVSALRKERGYTQKELASRLFISDKAVSKWETGASIPDTALLIPLSQLLEVTVTELLMCQRTQQGAIDANQVESIVKTAIVYTDGEQVRAYQNKSKWKILYFLALLLGCGELFWLSSLHLLYDTLLTMVLLGAVFGAYFCFFARIRLPSYHDENRIYSYGDGLFRMNIPGVAINNSNWPYIVLVGRIWTVAMMAVYPLLCGGMMIWFPQLWQAGGLFISLALILGGLFLPMIVVGKKYE